MIRARLAGGFALFCSLLFTACGGGGGGGDSDGPPANPAPFDGLRTLTLDDFPHSIDLYGVSNADKAVVILHGAGGRNYGVARDLGLNSNDGPPSQASIDFARLRAHKILAVFPQGQAIGGNAYTWDNHVMVSGEDDVEFLKELAAFIRSEYGISHIYLMGHSNGGMMANRFWCESPSTFDAYIAIAGPASAYYLDHACTPTLKRPYYGIVGNSDTVIGASGNWSAATWTINKVLVGVTFEGAYADPDLIGEWQLHQRHANTTCAATPTLLQASRSSNNNVDTWLDCSGKLKVQRVYTADHKISSLQSAAGFNLFDAAADFIDSQN